jgi:hypothetical protein
MNRENHYEAAFEEYLRTRQVPYVAVDESKRSLMAEASIKSLDFIVSGPEGCSWLIDVKGRRFPGGAQKQYWKNWSTRDDLVSMAHWERLFGARFQGLFVFAYDILGDRAPVGREQLFEFRDNFYGFVGVRLLHYAYYAKQISPRWDTVAMPAERFRELAEPLERFLHAATDK